MDFASYLNSLRSNATTPTSNVNQFTSSPLSDLSERIRLAELNAQTHAASSFSGFGGFGQPRPQPQPSWNAGFQSNPMSNYGLPQGYSYYQPSVTPNTTQTQTQSTGTGASTAPGSIFNRQFPSNMAVPGRNQPSTMHEALDDWLSEKTKISKTHYLSHGDFLDSRATIKKTIDESLPAWSGELDARVERTALTMRDVLTQARSGRLDLASLERLSTEVDELNEVKSRYRSTVDELIGFVNKSYNALIAAERYARFSSAQLSHRDGTMTEELVDGLRSDYKGLSHTVNGTSYNSHWDQFKQSGLSLAHCPPVPYTCTASSFQTQSQNLPTGTTGSFNNPYSLYGAFGNSQPTSQFGLSASQSQSQREDDKIDSIARILESSGQYQAARELREEYRQEKTLRMLSSLGLGGSQTQSQNPNRSISLDDLFNGLS